MPNNFSEEHYQTVTNFMTLEEAREILLNTNFTELFDDLEKLRSKLKVTPKTRINSVKEID